MVELSVGACSHLVYHCGLEVEEEGTGHEFACSCLGEESSEGLTFWLVKRHLAIGGDSMFKTEEFPAGVADLHSSLSDM